jgi:hypothetical protein
MTEDEMKAKWLTEVMERSKGEPDVFDSGEEYHWESMAYGFFLALGAEPEQAQRMAYVVET